MSTISASTTSTTGFKVTSDTTGTLVFQTGASPTTAMSISSSQIISFTNPPTATGGGSVATNTAYGTSALAANTTGTRNTAVGSGAAGATTTGNGVTAVGYNVLANNITGTGITAIGGSDVTSGGALQLNTSGNFNTAVGTAALFSNTTASNNTAVGYQAGYSNQTGNRNTFIGDAAGYNSTAGSNTAIGKNAGYAMTTGSNNTLVGGRSDVGNNTGAGFALTTGGYNNFFGGSAGGAITTGSKNTVLGNYDGNQGGLDIRTSSNYIVLSDGDGNPRTYWNDVGHLFCYNLVNNDFIATFKNTGTSAPYGIDVQYSGVATNNTSSYFYRGYDAVGVVDRFYVRSNGGIANYQANNVNLSDRREKTNFSPAGDYLAKICAIPVQTFNYIDQNLEEDAGLTLGVVAQDVQAIAPELVMESNWASGGEEPKMRLSIYQTDLQYALMKALQELKAEFDAYKEAHP